MVITQPPGHRDEAARVSAMAWTTPEHSKTAVRKAGKTLVRDGATSAEREAALTIVNNWRAAHGYPLNALSMNLRNWAGRLNLDVVPAQRIKRLPSIEQKLRRRPDFSLASIQDIGGTRLVVQSVAEVRAIESLALKSRQAHQLIKCDDYLKSPKESGYRSLHLVYEYRSRSGGRPWDGLRVELQVRTALQHAWATAVETVGLFTNQALKASRGDEGWLRFFALMSAELAIAEGLPLIPGVPTDDRRRLAELRSLAQRLDVVVRLDGYRVTVEHVAEQSQAAFWLLALDPAAQTLTIAPFTNQESASETYNSMESNKGLDVVLVRSTSFSQLQRAYPNYFSDTKRFVDIVNAILAGDDGARGSESW